MSMTNQSFAQLLCTFLIHPFLKRNMTAGMGVGNHTLKCAGYLASGTYLDVCKLNVATFNPLSLNSTLLMEHYPSRTTLTSYELEECAPT